MASVANPLPDSFPPMAIQRTSQTMRPPLQPGCTCPRHQPPPSSNPGACSLRLQSERESNAAVVSCVGWNAVEKTNSRGQKNTKRSEVAPPQLLYVTVDSSTHRWCLLLPTPKVSSTCHAIGLNSTGRGDCGRCAVSTLPCRDSEGGDGSSISAALLQDVCDPGLALEDVRAAMSAIPREEASKDARRPEVAVVPNDHSGNC